MSDYEKELTINQSALDKEWREQPFRFMYYVKESVKAEMEAKRAKEALELVKSEMYLTIREKKEFQGMKFTEALLDAEVKMSEEYKTASDAYFKALEESGILEGAVKAFDQRKAALENLVKLHIAGYCSSPKEPKGDDEIISGMSQDKQRQKLNNKKRRA